MATTSRRRYKPRVSRPPRIDGDIAIVPLTRGYEAIIDAADAPMIAQWNWYTAKPSAKHIYGCRWRTVGEGGGAELLHRTILGAATGEEVDHISGDTLDNRRANLRICAPKQNRSHHIGLASNNTAGGMGVTYRVDRDKYHARIVHYGDIFILGDYDTVAEAAAAYAGAARVLWGEYAPKGIPG